MNMEGLSKPAYDNINDELHFAYENAANKSMSKAAEEIKTFSQKKLESDTDISLCQCSIDVCGRNAGTHNQMELLQQSVMTNS